MMNGHKMDLFMLMLKYIILSIVLSLVLFFILAVVLFGTVASRGIFAIILLPFLIIFVIFYMIMVLNFHIEMSVRVAELYIAICEKYGY